jgi:hypothetical protein
MGLFDKRDRKRGKDDFDSPTEAIDLDRVGSAAEAPAPASSPAAATTAPSPTAAAPKPAPKPAPALALPAPDSDSYGIDKAIELMRTLPSENIQLVVQVVKFSLESVGIKLPIIIDDATRRQKDLRGRVDVLKSEISDLEKEIADRKAEIEKHEADYRETTMVRERLELAEGLGKPAAAASTPTPAATTPTPTPAAPTLPGTPRPGSSTIPPLNASAPKK